jgi:CRISPR/Cas system-associated exonuclease Cas4 (RecB family)
MKSMRDLIKMYLEEDFPVTQADFKCGYCQYLELCPKYAIPGATQ